MKNIYEVTGDTVFVRHNYTCTNAYDKGLGWWVRHDTRLWNTESKDYWNLSEYEKSEIEESIEFIKRMCEVFQP